MRGLFVIIFCLVVATSATYIIGNVEDEFAFRSPVFVNVEFNLELVDDVLADFEQVYLTGDLLETGEWHPDRAIPLTRTKDYNWWTASISLPDGGILKYRYFIGAKEPEKIGSLQVRRWESQVEPRIQKIDSGAQTDIFGYVNGLDLGEREVQRGWLHSGRIVQFKLFRNPLKINDVTVSEQQLRVKIQPVDPTNLSPILPSTRAHTEYVRMQYGNSYLRDQPDYGVPYELNDVVIYHTTLSEMNRVAYIIRVYSTIGDTDDTVRFVGYQYVYPKDLNRSDDSLSLELISPISLYKIGSLNLEYLVITPLEHDPVGFQTSFVDYWRPQWTGLEAGHRGLGRSLKQTTNAAPIIENTVASMKAAGALGADMVEFDVQLTKDSIPIIYHDFVIYVAKSGVEKPTNTRDLDVVPLQNFYYAELINITTYQTVGLEVVEYPPANTVANIDERLFPTFEAFLTEVDPTVGFDIEIKYPQRLRNGNLEALQPIDRNHYIDRIVEVMLEHGCGRLSFFTSFDADVCTMLRFKQNIYPVMQLYSSKDGEYADPRHDSIFEAVNNAQAFDLTGVVPNAVYVKNDPNWVEVATHQNKHMFIWGNDIDNTESVEWFKAQGVTGVIYDRMDLWLPSDKENIFGLEDDLPQYFLLQCTNGTTYEPPGPTPIPTTGTSTPTTISSSTESSTSTTDTSTSTTDTSTLTTESSTSTTDTSTSTESSTLTTDSSTLTTDTSTSTTDSSTSTTDGSTATNDSSSIHTETTPTSTESSTSSTTDTSSTSTESTPTPSPTTESTATTPTATPTPTPTPTGTPEPDEPFSFY